MEVHYGVGRHAVHIPPPDLIKAVQWIWISAPFSTMSACFGKISIALLILRMINRNRAYSVFLWSLIVLLFVINLVLTIITFAQCTPVEWLWDQLNPMAGYTGTCWHPDIQKNYGYFQGAFSAFSDLVLALFPILIIKDLKIDMKLKIGLCAVMGLGIIATVAACIKTVELKNLATPDFTFQAIDLIYWYLTENWIIVIAACIPTLGPLYFIVTGQRTAESFAATPGKGSGGGSGTGASTRRRLLSGWKLRSPIVRTTDASVGSDKFSRLEKGNLSGSSSSQNSTVNDATLTNGTGTQTGYPESAFGPRTPPSRDVMLGVSPQLHLNCQKHHIPVPNLTGSSGGSSRPHEIGTGTGGRSAAGTAGTDSSADSSPRLIVQTPPPVVPTSGNTGKSGSGRIGGTTTTSVAAARHNGGPGWQTGSGNTSIMKTTQVTVEARGRAF